MNIQCSSAQYHELAGTKLVPKETHSGSLGISTSYVDSLAGVYTTSRQGCWGWLLPAFFGKARVKINSVFMPASLPGPTWKSCLDRWSCRVDIQITHLEWGIVSSIFLTFSGEPSIIFDESSLPAKACPGQVRSGKDFDRDAPWEMIIPIFSWLPPLRTQSRFRGHRISLHAYFTQPASRPR